MLRQVLFASLVLGVWACGPRNTGPYFRPDTGPTDGNGDDAVAPDAARDGGRIPCTSSRMCGGQVCSPTLGYCVDCNTNVDCPVGMICRSNTCGAAPRVCTPGEATCTSLTQRRVCNPDGLGYTTMTCASTESCAGGTCRARTCTPGMATCAGSGERVVCNADGLGTTTVPCGAGATCVSGVCTGGSGEVEFRVASYGATGCGAVDHGAAGSGDDRGGVAVSSSTLFVNADSTAVRMSSVDLSGVTAVSTRGPLDGLVSDLRTERVYVLLTATNAQPSGSAMITQLGELDGMTGALTATRIALSAPIMVTYGTGIFAGHGRILLGVPGSSLLNWWHIEMPSGIVTRLGDTAQPPHNSCETWAWWGVAENFGGEYYADYVYNNAINRLRVPRAGALESPPTAVSTFTRLGDMCSITVSPSQNRWYFHHEYDSQFSATPGGEIAGFCAATIGTP